MIFNTFINISTCFDLEILRQMTQFAIDFDKEYNTQNMSAVTIQHCNNIFMFKDYITNQFNDLTQDIIFVKHVLNYAEDAEKLLTTNVSVIKNDGMDVYRMIKFVNWFYNMNEKIYLDSKKSEKQSIDDKLLDFYDNKLHLKVLQDVKTTYLDTLDLKTSEKEKYFENIDDNDFFQTILGITNTEEAITFGLLKKCLEKATPLLIDIKQHIEPAEECIFAIFAQSRKTAQRISRYFYHLGGVCYENIALNMGVEIKTIKAFENVKSIKSFMMDAIKYTEKESTHFHRYVENFNKYFNGNITERILGEYLKTAETDVYGRYVNALKEIETKQIDKEPESISKEDEVESDSEEKSNSELEEKPNTDLETEKLEPEVEEPVTEIVDKVEKITLEKDNLNPAQVIDPAAEKTLENVEVEKKDEVKLEDNLKKDDSNSKVEKPVDEKTDLKTDLKTEESEKEQKIDSVTGEKVFKTELRLDQDGSPEKGGVKDRDVSD